MSDSINNYNNPYLYSKNTQFQGGAVPDKVQEKVKEKVQDNHANSMLRDMDLPATPDEFVKFIPCWGAGLAMGGAVKYIIDKVSKAKNTTPESLYYSEAFQNSKLYKIGKSIDKVVEPILSKNRKNVVATKRFLSRIKPNFIQDIQNKLKHGVMSNDNGIGTLTKSMRNGVYGQAVDDVIDSLAKVKPEQIEKLGVKDILTRHHAGKIDKLQAFEEIFAKIKDKPLKDIIVPKRLKVHKNISFKLGSKTTTLEAYLTRAKLLKGVEGSTGATRAFHKLVLGSAEGFAGFIGGPIGFLMNSIFLGSGVFRAVKAEKGEKTSTFMESMIGDMIGGYLIMFPVTQWFYKALGVKNLGRKSEDVLKYKNLLTETNHDIKTFKNSKKTIAQLEALKNEKVNAEMAKTITEKLKIAEDYTDKSAKDVINSIKGKIKSEKVINSQIDELAKLKKIKGNVTKVSFLKNPIEWLVRKPLRLAGKIGSVGLEMVPTKLGLKTGNKVMAKAGKFAKMGGGIGLRFFAIMALMEPFRKMFIKTSHAIFGRPTKSLLDEDEEDKKTDEAKKTKAADYHTPKVKMNDFLNQTKKTPAATSINQPVSQMVKNTLHKPVTKTPGSVENIPAATTINKEQVKEGLEPKRHYVPSSEPAYMFNQLNSSKHDSRVDKALSTAKYYEDKANELLNNV